MSVPQLMGKFLSEFSYPLSARLRVSLFGNSQRGALTLSDLLFWLTLHLLWCLPSIFGSRLVEDESSPSQHLRLEVSFRSRLRLVAVSLVKLLGAV